MKEASPLGAKRMVEMGEEHRQMTEEDDLFNVEDAGERKLLSRYGIWLLVELCRPQEDIPIVSCWLSQPWFVKKTNLKVYVLCFVVMNSIIFNLLCLDLGLLRINTRGG